MQRLFPDIRAIKAKKHNEWLEHFATEATKAMDDVNKKNQEDEDEGKMQQLEGQVKHYKSVLAETVI